MELIFLGPGSSICLIDSAGQAHAVRKGKALPGFPSHVQKLFLLEAGDLSEKANSYLLFVQGGHQSPFLIVLSSVLPDKFRPCIHTRGQRQSFFVQKGTNVGAAGTELALYAGEELEVTFETGVITQTIRLKAIIDKTRDDNERILFSRMGSLTCEDALLPIREGSPHRYLIHRPLGGSPTADYFIKQLVIQENDTPDEFAKRARAFRDRANQIARYKEAWSHHYVQILDPDGGGNIYREPFILLRHESLDSKTPSLKDYVEHRGLSQLPGYTSTPSIGIGYDAAWSVLTQVAWVSEVFHINGALGHGELTPDNILLRPVEEDGRLAVVICDFAYDTFPKPADGFFVSDAANQLNDWYLRDRFALGSLLYYMIMGRVPDPCTTDGLPVWRDKHIDRLNAHHDVAKRPVAEFLREAWSLENRSASNLLKALDQPSMHPQLPDSPTDQRPTLRPWMLLLGIALFFFVLVDVTAFSAWRNHTPLGLEALHAFMNVAAPLPTITPTGTLTSSPWAPTATVDPTVATAPTPTMTLTLTREHQTSSPTTTLSPTPTSSGTPHPSATLTASGTPTLMATSSPTITRTDTPSPAATHAPASTTIPTQTATPFVSINPKGCRTQFVRITSPVNWDVIRGDIVIIGQVYLDEGHPKGFHHYQLDYRPIDQPGDWVNIVEPEDRPDKPHKNAPLATLRVNNLRDGLYALRLRLVDKSGNFGNEGSEYPDCIVVFTLDTSDQ